MTQQDSDIKRLEEIKELAKHHTPPPHCEICGACLLTGAVHSPCILILEFARVTTAFKYMARTR
jgi:hypothetical protein